MKPLIWRYARSKSGGYPPPGRKSYPTLPLTHVQTSKWPKRRVKWNFTPKPLTWLTASLPTHSPPHWFILPNYPAQPAPKHPRSRSSKNPTFPAPCPRKISFFSGVFHLSNSFTFLREWQLRWRTKLRLVIRSSVVRREPAARVDQGKSVVM